MKKHLIKSIKNNSIAEELEIKAGSYLLMVNDPEIINEVKDKNKIVILSNLPL